MLQRLFRCLLFSIAAGCGGNINLRLCGALQAAVVEDVTQQILEKIHNGQVHLC